LHFQQLFHVLEKMGYDWYTSCVHVPFGLVSLEDGTLSTRNGRVVFLEDVLKAAVEKTYEIVKEKGVNAELIDETAKTVGIGAVKFQELSAGRIKDYVFNWDKILNFDGETGPYVQYTHARAASILRDSELDINSLDADSIDYNYLSSESAYELIKLIYRFSEVVLDAAEKYEPSVITRYIVDVAQVFNKFYHDEHIIKGVTEEEKKAKVLLTYAAKTTLANGLGLLGIKAPDRM
ncbi:MAG: arginine--tRNA ligase, partial [Clostridia bacterium]|nr:arginine--tRNA ligase [Clostridia bacterium]